MFCSFCSVTVATIILVVAYYVIDLVLRSLKIGKVTDKHVLVTGCDTGFGHLTAVKLDKLGFHVFAGCLTKDGAKTLSETCSSRLTPIVLDIGSTESIQQAVQLVQQKLPSDTGLWALINNAGVVGLFAPMEFSRRQDILPTLNINVLGSIDMIHHFLPLIRKSKGRIVNTSSICGRIAFIPISYTVSKFALEAISDKLRREVRKQGIKVSVVNPGAFKTPIFAKEKLIGDLQKAFDRYSPGAQAAYGGTELINKARKLLTELETSGSANLDLVVDAYIHAITSKFPRTRYIAGNDAKYFWIPLSRLPDCISDFVLARMM